MNNECNGDIFIAEGQVLYCCFLDSTIVSGAANGEICPHCNRVIDARYHGELPTKTIRIVDIPKRGRVPLPEDVHPVPPRPTPAEFMAEFRRERRAEIGE